MPARKFAALAAALALLTVAAPARAITLWIDTTQPVPGNTFFQTWGQVITAPTSNSFLQSISLSPVDDVVNPATNFGVSIFDWS